MNKILDFGRKALFYARVLSGYEERRIRSYRLQVEKRIKQAEERKLAIRKLPEQTILSEVRRMVEEMQNLNKKLEETEAAIEDYFKPLDQEAQRIMKTQLEGEERTMKQMMKTMHDQAMLDIAEEERKIKAQIVDTNQKNQDPRPNTQHLPPPP
ncbi:vicilin-like seed storage protein At2g18540 [Rosa rugosa]|uniref:Uncharacterized protein n=2 Tax=Rosa chinensis TaxID=74649 RepID=A0A2P6P8X8_ROSCH|nr:vicilin-like seed storage protein At2g18540 [Rosa rugosa]XP_062027019.1 vicilin-like seed storage protein At2g18540 [Rosa rugosa]PRQ18372.1 hypothetical protein RchiOBHm_Chr7g0205301 [Rosa chinensis]